MKVSIITVCKNAENTIEETIKSIKDQTYKNIEYTIIDGKSTDKTIEIINKYKSIISLFVSEPDTGLYNAMNKGLKNITGDVVFFLNADDSLYDCNVIEDVVQQLQKNSIDILYGDLVAFEHIKNTQEIQKSNSVDKLYWMNQCVCHQVIFYKSELFKKYGFYDENYKIAADYDFNLRCIIKNKVKTYYYPRLISKFTIGGFGHTNKSLYEQEQTEISKQYFSTRQLIIKKFLFKNCRTLIRNKYIRKLLNLFI